MVHIVPLKHPLEHETPSLFVYRTKVIYSRSVMTDESMCADDTFIHTVLMGLLPPLRKTKNG